MYEIELPSFLSNFTASREGQGGVVGTIFMALTFTIISFACVAPFLGGFSGTAASERPLWHNLLGGMSFAVAFALPFFFLALFPSLLRKLPKSGSWLNAVKVVMGFLELAAALKFCRAAELIHSHSNPSFLTFDFVLGIWIALCVLCGLYLINAYRLPHDSPAENIGVPRLMFAAGFFALALFLTPALFKSGSEGESQRPRGVVYAWVESFLLPDGSAGEHPHTGNLVWAITQYESQLKAGGKPKRLFVDFTGVICTNCRYNEKNIFSRPAVRQIMEKFTTVKLYADTVPTAYYSPRALKNYGTERASTDAQDHQALQKAKFNGEDLPLYAILEPRPGAEILIVDIYSKGLIRDEKEFVDFLQKNLGP
jgi:thiol:disulfide interchange protein DsbD